VSGARHQALGLGAMAARNGTGTGRQSYGPRAGFTGAERRGSDGDWRDRAACSGADPEAWFPISSVGEGLEQALQAKAICKTQCPVKLECLRFALAANCGDGIFGGGRRARRRLRDQGAPHLRILCHAHAP